MQILLDKPELEQFVRSQVDGGQYASPAAVIEAALSEFMARDFAPGEMEQLIAEGEESLVREGPLDIEDVFKRLEAKSIAARARAGR